LDTVILDKKSLYKNVLTKLDWNKLRQLVKILQLFKEATTTMSALEYLTSSMAVPLYYELFKILEEFKQKKTIPQWLILGCEAVMKKLLNYCNKTSLLHFIAIILDL
ncbi:13453_t:CDS:1, partial [Cetraspora pellucida]